MLIANEYSSVTEAKSSNDSLLLRVCVLVFTLQAKERERGGEIHAQITYKPRRIVRVWIFNHASITYQSRSNHVYFTYTSRTTHVHMLDYECSNNRLLVKKCNAHQTIEIKFQTFCVTSWLRHTSPYNLSKRKILVVSVVRVTFDLSCDYGTEGVHK